MTEDQHQELMIWLEKIGRDYGEVHGHTGDEFVILSGDEIADINEIDERLLAMEGMYMEKIGYDLAEDTGTYRVYLPDEYQE